MSERYGNGWAYARPTSVVTPLPVREVSDDELAEIPASRLLREPPRRDWMVDNLFVRGTVGMVSGAGSIGKTLLCQQLATCAVLGPAMARHEPETRQGAPDGVRGRR